MSAARLLIGPVLRRVVDDPGHVWVETGAPAVVTVRAEGGGEGSRARPSRRTGTTTRWSSSRGCGPDADTPYEVFVDERAGVAGAGLARTRRA